MIITSLLSFAGESATFAQVLLALPMALDLLGAPLSLWPAS